jgi:hypothetical protein
MAFRTGNVGALVLVAALAACTSAGPDYSPEYRYVATSQGGDAKGVSGSVLAPEACLGTPADQEPPSGGTRFMKVPKLGPHLPPGCANAYNLQRMAESQRDLVEGRTMGPPPAAPSVRAARRYIYGTDEAPEEPQGEAPTTP